MDMGHEVNLRGVLTRDFNYSLQGYELYHLMWSRDTPAVWLYYEDDWIDLFSWPGTEWLYSFLDGHFSHERQLSLVRIII